MKTALLSCYDKTGLVEFAQGLQAHGYQLISTGGTFKHLKNAGLSVLEVSDITQFPELFDGRVKTLHPRIFAGILYRRNHVEDQKDLENHQLMSIDLVVNTLYPFEETLNTKGATHQDLIEKIDIGGPSLIRAAAKNYQDVTIIVDPKDYPRFLSYLEKQKQTSLEQRQQFAAKAFNYTAYYDSVIASYFNSEENNNFPEFLTKGYVLKQTLRYGENPHQAAAFYQSSMDKEQGVLNTHQIHGKELSFNNIFDANSAINIVKEFSEPTAVAIKHANPCGVGCADTIYEAYLKAYASDTSSIFGGIVALNREVDKRLANKLHEIFLEIIIAPGFSDEALEILTKKKNLRLLVLDMENIVAESMAFKQVENGLLLQEKDFSLYNEFEVVSKLEPSEEEIKDLEFAWKVAKHINSNGIVLVKDRATIGLGIGFVNRFFATEEALKRAGKKAAGAILASDGFFPFADSIEALGEAKVSAVIQPGGSIKDNEVIEAADKLGLKMIFTKMRHFKH